MNSIEKTIKHLQMKYYLTGNEENKEQYFKFLKRCFPLGYGISEYINDRKYTIEIKENQNISNIKVYVFPNQSKLLVELDKNTSYKNLLRIIFMNCVMEKETRPVTKYEVFLIIYHLDKYFENHFNIKNIKLDIITDPNFEYYYSLKSFIELEKSNDLYLFKFEKENKRELYA